MTHKTELEAMYKQEQTVLNELMANAPSDVTDTGFGLLDWAVKQPEAVAIADKIKQIEKQHGH